MSLASLPIRHPSRVYLSVAPILALGALSPTPSLTPLVLLLGVLRLHTFHLAPRRKWGVGVTQGSFISLAIAIVHAGPSLHALSTPFTSIFVLALLSAFTTIVAGLALAAAYYAERGRHTSWRHATMFPAIWATVWAVVEYCSPIGQLTTWSPIVQLGGYAWLRSYGGQVAINWVVGAWAVVLADVAGAWIMELDDEIEGDAHPPLISFASDDRLTTNGSAYPKRGRRTRRTLLLATILIALAAPSYVMPDMPPPVSSPDVTPFGVACALPYPQRNGVITGTPSLEHYVAESKTLQAQAKVVLWPESAVHFGSSDEREETFKRISAEISNGTYWAIGFDEVVQTDSSDGVWKVGMRRNGLIMLGWEGVVYEYYKRHLVPIAESFSMTPSNEKPSIFTMQLKHPRSYSAPKWAPAPNYTRPIDITASICLDFSTAASFAGLESRPALILAPARTWHTSVGLAMWEQAKARADETGSMVLWCDGGEGGVSGIAGRGMHAFRQVGPGSWTQTVSVPWPFDSRRTVFSAAGTSAALAIVWGIMGTSWMAGGVASLLEGREDGTDGALGRVLALVSRPSDIQHTPEPLEEDFEEISYDELRLSLCPADPAHFAPVFDYQRAYRRSLLSRSRTSFTRLRKLSQASLKKSREVIGRSKLRESTSPDSNTDREPHLAIVHHSASSDSSSDASNSPRTPPHYPSALLLETGPFGNPGLTGAGSPEVYTEPAEHIVTEPDDLALVVSATRPSRAKSISSSLKRLRTLSKASLFSGARRHAPQVCQILPTESSGAHTLHSPQSIQSHKLPELVFEQIDLSSVLDEDQRLAIVPISQPDHLPQDPSPPRIEISKASPRISSTSLQLRLPRFEFVDPNSLAASIPPSAVEGASLFGSAAPSPSWLSRNVQTLEAAPATDSPAPLPIPPPPSPPLYIVPRSLRPDTYYLRGPEIEFEFTTAPQTPESTSSSLTLFDPSQRESLLAPTSVVGSRPTSLNRLSAIYRRSIVDNRQSLHSIVAYSQERNGVGTIRNTSLNVFLVPSETCDQTPSLTPLALDNPLSSLPEPELPDSAGLHTIWTPHPKAHEYSEAVNFQPPPYLISFVKQIIHTSSMNMDLYHKEADTVDWGGEADYSGYEWFKDPPPRPEPQPQATTDNYVPQPGVIEQNEAFDFALKSAPNVLYARFKQFGQLGVLAWCSEFSELIDALKQLGFEGNMFVSTRTQALKTCEEILRLKLDIEMQIIVMYLSSQIARLRRFLDSDRQWDDYPKPQFPLDPAEYGRDR
ncbi:hypothetical protein C8T65DRAFT_736201 [Cerioporus squamosus]|nr:hypothetical protein C8T65DRAFT_736201 [Cerioporus squamosus]